MTNHERELVEEALRSLDAAKVKRDLEDLSARDWEQRARSLLAQALRAGSKPSHPAGQPSH